MAKEITLRNDYLNDKKVNSIYFGGGTPSCLTSEEINSLLKKIYALYKINNNVEVTLECNPDDLTYTKLLEFKNIGVNRLSIGVQSFSNTDLEFMNRSHNAEEAIKSIKMAQQTGFNNISVDLIYGLPKQTLKKWKKNIDQLFSLGVQHFSAYALTIEKKTTLHHLIKNKTITPLTDKKIINQFNLIQIEAQKRGFIHYEISNFGLESFFSKHNTAYWKDNHYLGIGPSAHSYNGTERSWNIASNTKYISSINSNQKFFEEEQLNVIQQYNEYVLTSLRTIWGINNVIIKNRYGEKAELHFLKEIIKWKNKKYISSKSNVYTLTKEGKIFADTITSDLFII
tara:strand:+ start:12817 stop:13839 length:1023 start_codon:yes stop_codon:yes gene_type:complete